MTASSTPAPVQKRLKPANRIDTRLASALVLMILALGLPWGEQFSTQPRLGLVPGGCWMDQWGMMNCDPMQMVMELDGQVQAVAGAQSIARVFIVAAIVLTLLAAGRSAWLRAAAIVLIGGLLVTGLSMQAGQVAALVAAGLLLVITRDLRPGPRRKESEEASVTR